ncbi:hypothetical protein IAQ61_004945 [Plenodomus lingam]|uniref:Predicted protein n=1 Tax=Leptosphaeria maculans (strain JN3 / isolate v23.1.3 / race Av1-4-5-6-7-8) TaxID=985895 RepID=E4ZTA5_LEPMJ|nr:predicted protein [Plenodomus lingam JN3]KAH9872545.1 hypothetical protein IAQ61_004945 [Plenodomus lingam]CBX90047.1 predicted protein [Plenodomus lingam JN3]
MPRSTPMPGSFPTYSECEDLDPKDQEHFDCEVLQPEDQGHVDCKVRGSPDQRQVGCDGVVGGANVYSDMHMCHSTPIQDQIPTQQIVLWRPVPVVETSERHVTESPERPVAEQSDALPARACSHSMAIVVHHNSSFPTNPSNAADDTTHADAIHLDPDQEELVLRVIHRIYARRQPPCPPRWSLSSRICDLILRFLGQTSGTGERGAHGTSEVDHGPSKGALGKRKKVVQDEDDVDADVRVSPGVGRRTRVKVE